MDILIIKIYIMNIKSNHLYVEISYDYNCMDTCPNVNMLEMALKELWSVLHCLNGAQGTVVNPPLFKWLSRNCGQSSTV